MPKPKIVYTCTLVMQCPQALYVGERRIAPIIVARRLVCIEHAVELTVKGMRRRIAKRRHSRAAERRIHAEVNISGKHVVLVWCRHRCLAVDRIRGVVPIRLRVDQLIPINRNITITRKLRILSTCTIADMDISVRTIIWIRSII